MSKTVAIAGMGWLGLPLARHLEVLGYQVKGSVTSDEKAAKLRAGGYQAFTIEISEGGISGSLDQFLENADFLVIMIPPGLRKHTGADYVLKMTYFLSEIEKSNVENVILVSSTSVYGDAQGIVNEMQSPKPETQAGKQLLQVEQLFFTSEKIKTTIVRFGGLYGGSRQPVRYLAGRKELNNGDAPVNLIHRVDCIGILSEIIKQGAFGYVFNAVMPAHPKKRDYYSKTAVMLNLDPPKYSKSTKEEDFKQVDSVNISKILNYTFKKSL